MSINLQASGEKMWGITGDPKPRIYLENISYPRINRRSAVAKKRKHAGDLGAYSLAPRIWTNTGI